MIKENSFSCQHPSSTALLRSSALRLTQNLNENLDAFVSLLIILHFFLKIKIYLIQTDKCVLLERTAFIAAVEFLLRLAYITAFVI